MASLTSPRHKWEKGDYFFSDWWSTILEKYSWRLCRVLKLRESTLRRNRPGGYSRRGAGVDYEILFWNEGISNDPEEHAGIQSFDFASDSFQADRIFRIKDDPQRVIRVILS
jgi:hypothetical protein